MKLTTGSIVELNRTINEPVDIIVNNCTPLPVGRVIVVEGNFGVTNPGGDQPDMEPPEDSGAEP